MPSDQSTWLIAIPNDGEAEDLHQELQSKLLHATKSFGLAQFDIPSFKTGTLDSLINLSEDLPKQDSFFTNAVAKTVDTLRSLLNNDPAKLAQHILVEERIVDGYLFKFKWNEGRYGIQRSLREIVDTLAKEMISVDDALKSKLNNYNLVKSNLTQMERKKKGNLSVRSLVGIISKEDVVYTEYLETLFVAVPRALVKEWSSKYERLNPMVVPRSSKSIAADEEYTLFCVIAFKRVHDEVVQACRENKFIVREFLYSEDEITKQREDLETAVTMERELWTELLRLSRTNFSESFQILIHLKVLRLFVESVLRYGLPANYLGILVKPDPKQTKKTFNVLQAQFAYLGPRSSAPKGRSSDSGDLGAEYQTLLDQDFYDFVLFEVPWIVD